MSFAVFDKLIRFRVDADIFENGLKTLLMWTQIFLQMDKTKMRFQNYLATCRRGLKVEEMFYYDFLP